MKKWIPVILIAGTLMGGGAYWFHSRPYDASRLVQMLPPDRSVHVYLNFKALRDSGILDVLAGSSALEEPEYKKFVEETGFNYRTDLDGVAVAFRDGDVFYAAQGRFDWSKLSSYAASHQGNCAAGLCKVAGSVPGRDVTYYMPRTAVLAVATSRSGTAQQMIGLSTWGKAPVIPETGLWVLAPSFLFSDPTNFPDGTRFLSALKDSTETILMLGPSGGGEGSPAFDLSLEATFAKPEAAAEVYKQFVDTTALLVNMIGREGKAPNKNDLSGLLAGGKFETAENRVTAKWPVDRSLLEGLVNGIEIPGAK